MTPRRVSVALLVPALALAAAFAQARDAGPVSERAGAAVSGTAPAHARAASEALPAEESDGISKTPDAKIEHLVTEDSQVRIEETRVRGITTSIVVHSKIRGMGSYAIQPANPAIDRENDPAAGKRLWSWGF
jgi:hypothetical protein